MKTYSIIKSPSKLAAVGLVSLIVSSSTSLKADTSTVPPSITSSVVYQNGTFYPANITNTMSFVNNAWVSKAAIAADPLYLTNSIWDANSGTWLINGQPTTLSSSGTGLDSISGKYYVAGQLASGYNQTGDKGYYIAGKLTSLNADGVGYDRLSGNVYLYGVPYTPSLVTSGGSGLDTATGVYIINGSAAPDLNSSGNGDWSGKWYANGTLNGWNSDSGYVLNGVLVGAGQGLDHSGTGTWNGNYYLNGALYTPSSSNGYDTTSSNYYVNGQIATLTSAGNGIWNGVWYANGTTNGWNGDSGYVLNGVLVGVGQGLDHSGTGTWNGNYYLNGTLHTP